MKTQDEIQRAHDMLIGILQMEVPVAVPDEAKPIMCANLDVLCWILGCEHNQTFAKNIAEAEKEARAQGYVLSNWTN